MRHDRGNNPVLLGRRVRDVLYYGHPDGPVEYSGFSLFYGTAGARIVPAAVWRGLAALGRFNPGRNARAMLDSDVMGVWVSVPPLRPGAEWPSALLVHPNTRLEWSVVSSPHRWLS